MSNPGKGSVNARCIHDYSLLFHCSVSLLKSPLTPLWKGGLGELTIASLLTYDL